MKTIDSKEYYDKIKKLNIEHYAGEVSYYTQAPVRKVEQIILSKLKPVSSILDLGCGSGRFSIGAAQMGFNVTGVDITPEAINAAKQKAEKLGVKNINFLVGDMTNLPFQNKSFDYVFCPRFSINAVATFSQRKKAVEEMLRVVKDDGTVFIESFNKLYLGRGIVFFSKNIMRDVGGYFAILYAWLKNKKYYGLLPGDIVYESNKVKTASKGYAHLSTVFELTRLTPKDIDLKFYSIPQIQGKRFDLFKFFRYSIWLFLKKQTLTK